MRAALLRLGRQTRWLRSRAARGARLPAARRETGQTRVGRPMSAFGWRRSLSLSLSPSRPLCPSLAGGRWGAVDCRPWAAKLRAPVRMCWCNRRQRNRRQHNRRQRNRRQFHRAGADAAAGTRLGRVGDDVVPQIAGSPARRSGAPGPGPSPVSCARSLVESQACALVSCRPVLDFARCCLSGTFCYWGVLLASNAFHCFDPEGSPTG